MAANKKIGFFFDVFTRHIVIMAAILPLTQFCFTDSALGADAPKVVQNFTEIRKPSVATAASTKRDYQFGPAPSWVKTVSVDNVAGIQLAPVQVLLMDVQTRVSADALVNFRHYVRRIAEPAGLQKAGQIEIVYDPSYEKLVFHQLVVWRDGKKIDKLNEKLIKILHREQQLEQQIIDGRMTASIVLDDLRVGDRIEWAYSRLGSNPIFSPRYVDTEWFVSGSGPVGLAQVRLLSPANRVIRRFAPGQDFEIEETVKEGWRETLIRRRNIQKYEYDPLLPSSELNKEIVAFSEYADWREVAQWADGLFATAIGATGTARAIESVVSQIEASTTNPKDRFRLALDFVQKEIRYFGSEMGIHSHQPASPDKVMRQRFGDCKDKSALLVAILRRLGLNAYPVLVSIREQEGVVRQLPSPLAFDHAIVVVVDGDQLLWVDPTRSYETGNVNLRNVVGLGYGLVIKPETSVLSEMPSARDVLRIETIDRFQFPKLSEDARVESVATFYGEVAAWLRAQRASLSADEFEKILLSDLRRTYPTMRIEERPSVEDLLEENAVRVTVRGQTGDYWRFPEQKTLLADFALATLQTPLRLQDSNVRTRPMWLSSLGRYKHTIRHEFGEAVFSRDGGAPFEESSPQFSLSMRYANDLKSQTIEGELRMLSKVLPAGEWLGYRDRLTKIFPRLGNTFQVPAVSPQDFPRLKKESEDLEARISRGRIKAVTPIQVNARHDLLWLDNVLAAGRLPPKLRAQTLNARGIQLDTLGELRDGERAFKEALAIDATSGDILEALAVNAVLQKKDDEALAYAERALLLAPNAMQPRYVRVWTHYLRNDFSKARDEAAAILQSPTQVERGFGSIWLWLATRQLSGNAPASAAIPQPTSLQPAWPYPVLQFLQGKISFDAALDAAKSEKPTRLGRLCEFYFFAAQKSLLDGDTVTAKRYLRESINTGVVEFVEYEFAKRVLERLEANGV